MSIRKLINELRGELSWKEFQKLTGFSYIQLWKIERHGYSCPPVKIQILCALGRQRGITIPQEILLSLLLGGNLVEKLVDLELILEGRTPLDPWLKETDSQKDQAKILGLAYSTVFHHRSGRFQRFWPRRAIEIVRRSNYQIDLFDLLNSSRSPHNH